MLGTRVKLAAASNAYYSLARLGAFICLGGERHVYGNVLKVEDYPAPQGKGRYKVIAHSENAQTFEQRAQTAIQIAVDWHNKTQAYEILVWLEILPELSARVAIADYYPHNVTASERNASYQLQVEVTNYQAGMNGEYKSMVFSMAVSTNI